MLKHGRAGVPMEVMGLMLGEFVDDYTVRVIDVFAMPQSGTVIKFFRIFFYCNYNLSNL
jgi:proteasome lid subunit RPN8/RPN11